MSRIIKTYCVLTILWFLSNRFLQDSWWGLVVLDKFAEYFLFASVPVLLLSLFSRNKTTILSATVPVMVCAFFYLPFFLKMTVPDAAEDTSYFRMATFNIWNHNKDIEAVVALINSAQSDVIALQEITDVQQSELTERLSRTYPYYHVSKQVYGGTTALFSRHKLFNLVELDINIDRPAILADLDWHGTNISVASAHLNPSFWAYHQQPWKQIPGNYHQYIKDQNAQANMIIDAFKNRTGSQAFFLGCDCNSQETASTNRLLSTFFKDTFRSIGWQRGYPANQSLSYEHNLMHIDYVWYAGHVIPNGIYRTKDSVGSDHQQVLADFNFTL